MVKHTLKILHYEHPKIFKVCVEKEKNLNRTSGIGKILSVVFGKILIV